MPSGRSFKIGISAFLITVCVLGTVGGLVAVNEVSYRLSEGERKIAVTENNESPKRMASYLPPQWQALMLIPKWETELWEYYFTVLKAP